jgi:hypothetical protein
MRGFKGRPSLGRLCHHQPDNSNDDQAAGTPNDFKRASDRAHPFDAIPSVSATRISQPSSVESIGSGSQGQRQHESAALPQGGLHPDVTPVQQSHLPGQIQPEADARDMVQSATSDAAEPSE